MHVIVVSFIVICEPHSLMLLFPNSNTCPRHASLERLLVVVCSNKSFFRVYHVLKFHQLENFRHHGAGGIVREIAEHTLDLSGGSSCKEHIFSNVHAITLDWLSPQLHLQLALINRPKVSGVGAVINTSAGKSGNSLLTSSNTCFNTKKEHQVMVRQVRSVFKDADDSVDANKPCPAVVPTKVSAGHTNGGACNNYCMEEEEPGVAYPTSANLLEQALPFLASLSSICCRSWGVALVYVAAAILHNRCISSVDNLPTRVQCVLRNISGGGFLAVSSFH
jgi:hypothetical protein